MSKTKPESAQQKAKKNVVFDAALDVFAQYGFRRTTMNDVAQAAGISRPALYLMFNNKEHLFHELAAHRLELAIAEATSVLAGNHNIEDRFIDALLVHQKVYYEPVANSPHGAELIDTNLSLATDVMTKGYTKLIEVLANSLDEAGKNGEINFSNASLKPKAFVELLLSSLNGLKKKAGSTAELRKQTKQVAKIFLGSLIV
jgi:AcrR family transcriptional regulator